MICDVCKKEISYDRETVVFHVKQLCQQKPFGYWFDGTIVTTVYPYATYVGCGQVMMVNTAYNWLVDSRDWLFVSS